MKLDWILKNNGIESRVRIKFIPRPARYCHLNHLHAWDWLQIINTQIFKISSLKFHSLWFCSWNFPECLVEWFAFRKFNRFLIFWKLSQEFLEPLISLPFRAFRNRTESVLDDWFLFSLDERMRMRQIQLYIIFWRFVQTKMKEPDLKMLFTISN